MLVSVKSFSSKVVRSGFHTGGGSGGGGNSTKKSYSTDLDIQDDTLVNSGLTQYQLPYQRTPVKKLNGLYGYTPLFPLSFSKEGPYSLLVELKDVVKQNFKNLMLTEPGERIMDTEFGVGLRSFLFEQNTEAAKSTIQGRITSQVSAYMSYLTINQIEFTEDELQPNYLGISIYYSIPDLSIQDSLSFVLGE